MKRTKWTVAIQYVCSVVFAWEGAIDRVLEVFIPLPLWETGSLSEDFFGMLETMIARGKNRRELFESMACGFVTGFRCWIAVTIWFNYRDRFFTTCRWKWHSWTIIKRTGKTISRSIIRRERIRMNVIGFVRVCITVGKRFFTRSFHLISRTSGRRNVNISWFYAKKEEDNERLMTRRNKKPFLRRSVEDREDALNRNKQIEDNRRRISWNLLFGWPTFWFLPLRNFSFTIVEIRFP